MTLPELLAASGCDPDAFRDPFIELLANSICVPGREPDENCRAAARITVARMYGDAVPEAEIRPRTPAPPKTAVRHHPGPDEPPEAV